MTALLFVDFEASSLEPGSYPIEAGWCDERGHGEAHLIHPPRHWQTWSAAAEAVHRITREQLQAEGEPVREVARRAAEALATGRATVLSDCPPADQAWLDRLLAAGGVAARPLLLDLWQVIRDAGMRVLRDAGAPMAMVPDVIRDIEEFAARARAGHPPVHRALPDAQANAAMWRLAMKRTADIATLWRSAIARQPEHPEGER